MISFGISRMPGDDWPAFLDGLVEANRTAHELPFVHDFPWKERDCARFGELAAERGIALSIHAPYFAVLTVEEEDRRARCLSALEHTMKLCQAMGGRVVVAHAGNHHDRDPFEVLDLVTEGVARIEPKVRHLGVALGLETAGKASQFGTLGDISLVAERFSFVHPVVDWAHLHAMSAGGLTSPEAFGAVFGFLREHFPGWTIDPLHCQFTQSQFSDKGEIRHIPYGTGTMAIGDLARAALAEGMRLTVISEAREESSHTAMQAELAEVTVASRAPAPKGRALASGAIDFPDPVRVAPDGDRFTPLGPFHPLRLSNLDKPFFPDGYTKGDLIQYYASIAPVLLPHLADRAIVMARYPDGSEGEWFYEKQAPGHQPDWMPLAPIHSEHRGEPIEFVTARDRESLMWLAGMGCIEIHPWLSRTATVATPDFAIFDLDPSEGATWRQTRDVAQLVREVLGRLGLRGYPKVSGATGLHVYVPLDPVHPYRVVRGFVEAVGRLIMVADPDDVTMEWDIAKRGGKVFIDHNQNVGGKTIASVYSVRPRPGAPVSTPILWEELEDLPGPDAFTMTTIWDRLRTYGDLFAPVLRGGQRLDDVLGTLGVEAG